MHLTAELACALYGSPDRPLVCSGLQPALEMCGTSAADAMSTLIRWETLTTPHGRAERVR